MRTIKFRAWDKKTKRIYDVWNWNYINCRGEQFELNELDWKRSADEIELMQFTGLLDKNKGTCTEVYEGDIIDEYGKIKGNIYQMDKGETDLVIEGLGTASWTKTEMAGLGRGLTYAE